MAAFRGLLRMRADNVGSNAIIRPFTSMSGAVCCQPTGMGGVDEPAMDFGERRV
jgi:hypothetical protein